VLPNTIPVDYGYIKFQVTVAGRPSAVSPFTFYFHSSATVTGNPAAAVITSVSPATGMTPNVDSWATLYSSSGGFGQCAEMITSIYFTTSSSASTSSNFPYLCSQWEWVSPSEARCFVTYNYLYPDTITRYQIVMGGTRGPGSATTVRTWTKKQMYGYGPNNNGLYYESSSVGSYMYFSLPESAPYQLRLTATLSTSLPTSGSWPYPKTQLLVS